MSLYPDLVLKTAVSAHLQMQIVTLAGLCLQDHANMPRPHAAAPGRLLALTETDATETHNAESEDSGSSDSESDNVLSSDSESDSGGSESEDSGSESDGSGSESDDSGSESEGSDFDSEGSQSEEGGAEPEDSKAGCKRKGGQAEGANSNLHSGIELKADDVDNVKTEHIADCLESGFAENDQEGAGISHRMHKVHGQPLLAISIWCFG